MERYDLVGDYDGYIDKVSDGDYVKYVDAIAEIRAEREACKQACETQKVDAKATGDATDAAYNLALDHAMAAMDERSNVKVTGAEPALSAERPR